MSEQDAVIDALVRSVEAPGAVSRLEQLDMTQAAAQGLIRHLSRIPAFERHLTENLDFGRSAGLVDLGTERLVFLHLPKCGGTTLHNMLVGWYGADNLHAERHNDLYFRSALDLASKTLFSGHYDYYATQLIPGRRRVVTLLREPRSRLVSLYNFHRSHREEVVEQYNLTLARWAQMYDIDEYFADPAVRAHPAINNSLVRHLSNEPQQDRIFGNAEPSKTPIGILRDQAIANLADLDFVGLMEDYENSIERLAALLGKSVPKTIGRARDFDNLVETDPNMKRIEQQQPTATTHALMDELVAADEALYGFAGQLCGAG